MLRDRPLQIALRLLQRRQRLPALFAGVDAVNVVVAAVRTVHGGVSLQIANQELQIDNWDFLAV
jgi:hypothetical protein